MRKTANHKGSCLSLPHHLFVPLNYTHDLQEVHLRAWERYSQSDIIPLQGLHDFIFVFITMDTWQQHSSYPADPKNCRLQCALRASWYLQYHYSPSFASLDVHVTCPSAGSQPRGWSISSSPLIPAHRCWVGSPGVLSLPGRKH